MTQTETTAQEQQETIATLPRDLPILFSGSMVEATLELRKTNTRRVIQLPSWSTKDWNDFETDGESAEIICASTGCSAAIPCPYGTTGSRLWVRETFYAYGRWEQRWSDKKQRQEWHFVDETIGEGHEYRFFDSAPQQICRDRSAIGWFKRPAIFMPRHASRILLGVNQVRVQALQDITAEDAIAEGVPPFNWNDGFSLRPIPAFRRLWDSINGKRPGCNWDANPNVWAVGFTLLEQGSTTAERSVNVGERKAIGQEVGV